MRGITETVKYIIAINVILWLATILLFKQNILDLDGVLAFHYPGSPLYKPWQFITHMFMHASLDPGTGQVIIYHLLFNMFGVWMFGSPLERLWGRNKFIFFYISAGLGAVFLQWGYYYYQYSTGMDLFLDSGYSVDQVERLMTMDLRGFTELPAQLLDSAKDMQSIFLGAMLGASGALYGILVAFAFTYPNTELMMIFLPIPIKAKFFVPLIIAGDLFFGFSNYSTGIAHFAHIGGAIAGFIMMWYWKKNSFNDKRWN